MGWMSALSNWQSQRFEKHRSKMEEQGKCPDCNGRGFAFPSAAIDVMGPEPCPGCNGTGLYSDWVDKQDDQ